MDGGQVSDGFAQERIGPTGRASAGKASVERFIAGCEYVGIEPAESGLATDPGIDAVGLLKSGDHRLIVVGKIAVHAVVDHIVLGRAADNDWFPTRQGVNDVGVMGLIVAAQHKERSCTADGVVPRWSVQRAEIAC